MLHENAVLQNGDLRAIPDLPHDHDAVDGLTAGEELRLGQDRCPASSGIAALATALALGLEPGRAL